MNCYEVLRIKHSAAPTGDIVVAIYRMQFNVICLKTTLKPSAYNACIGMVEGYERWAIPEHFITIPNNDCYEYISTLTEFETNQVYCKIKPILNAIISENTVKSSEIRICECCHKKFIPTTREQKYCDTLCYTRAHNRRHKKLRQFKGGSGTKYDIYDIFARDNGICWICGKKCNFEDYTGSHSRKTFRAGPNYPTIDHIKPISLGGKHDLSNIRIAHNRCNNERASSYSPVEQMSEKDKRDIYEKTRREYQKAAMEAIWESTLVKALMEDD